MPRPITLILHAVDAPRRVLPQPDGRRVTEAGRSAVIRCDVAALLEKPTLRADVEALLAALGPDAPTAADVSLDAGPQWRPLADRVMEGGLYESVWCVACGQPVAPRDVERSPYRQEHGSWGTNAGTAFYCKARHRLYDHVIEQTA